MKIPFSITFKLLLFILPLVCLPTAIVGYLSYHTSVERVTHLSRNEQMMRAKAAASRIDGIFQSCRMDMETITRLPAIEDYYYNMIYRLEAEAEDSRKKIEKLFKDFIARSPYYYQIRFLDNYGHEVVRVCADGHKKQLSVQRAQSFFQKTRRIGQKRIYISEINYSPSRKGFVVYFGKIFINIP